ncbi:MAG: hypothetical protein ACREJ9_13470 [Candidatus Rokuibacteriota bacterium]
MRLARREDPELERRFRDVFRAWAARTPAFLPWPWPRGAREGIFLTWRRSPR